MLSTAEIVELRRKTGEFLQNARNDLKISQEQFSEISGLTRNTISAIETGARGYHFDSLIIYQQTIIRENIK